MSPAPRTPVIDARSSGYVGCGHCGLVLPLGSQDHCPRCGGALQSRKTDSLSRSAAYLLASAVMIVPANLLPIMKSSSLMGEKEDTILSGILFFWNSGSPGLAALIFFVSILIPLAKLGSMTVLLWSVHHGKHHYRQHRAHLFRLVELVGRWSMLDIFVVALMVGLVHFQGLAIIEAGPGAAAFGAVVVLTMLAAHSFDARLIWDHPNPRGTP